MKKLLTILVSAASACFAFADDAAVFTESGTSFGDTTVNATEGITFDITAGDAELANTENKDKRFWYSLASGTDADYGIITNYESNTASTPIASRPGMWANVANKNYLKLDTSDTLFRTIDGMNRENTAPKTVDIGQGIYFDSLVQFTATEDNVSPSDGDKLVVWLKAVEGTDAVGNEDEEGYQPAIPASTKLMITAGKIDENGNISTVDYEGTVEGNLTIENNSWHRLTIKTFIENEAAVFEVYVDGKIVTGMDSTTKFLSRVAKGATGAKTISGVGFKGTGAVDDLAFTTSDPLVQTFPLSVVVPDECTVISCLVGGDDIEATEEETYLVDVTATDVKVKVEVPLAFNVTNANAVPGEIVDGMQTWTVPVSITGATANTPVRFTVTIAENEVPAAKPFSITIAGETTAYETLAEAIAKANGEKITLTENATLTGTLSIGEGVTAVIDLAGKTLTAGTVENYSVVVKGDLKITDSIGGGEMILPGIYGIGVNGDNAKLVLEKADFIGEDADYLVGLWSGSVTVNSGTFVADYNIINVFGDGKAVVNDGTFTTQGDNDLENYDPNCVFLSDNDDAITVNGGMFSTTFKSAFCKKGFKLTEENGVWILVDETEEPELPEVAPEVDEEGKEITTTEPYSDAAKTCLTTYFPKASQEVPAPALAVVINGEELFGNAAVEAINDVADKFTGNPFDANGTINLVFKVDDVMKALADTEGGYTLTVGTATLKDTYEVAPKFIDLANPGVEIKDPGEGATEKFFKLVIREKSVQ